MNCKELFIIFSIVFCIALRAEEENRTKGEKKSDTVEKKTEKTTTKKTKKPAEKAAAKTTGKVEVATAEKTEQPAATVAQKAHAQKAAPVETVKKSATVTAPVASTDTATNCLQQVMYASTTATTVQQYAPFAQQALACLDPNKYDLSNVNPNVTDHNGSPLLSLATFTGSVELTQKLLSLPGINVNLADHQYGYTPLMNAAGISNLITAKNVGNYAKILQLLIKNGANVNAQVKQYGTTALITSAISGYQDLVTALLTAKGINVNLADNQGYTPLTWALANSNITSANQKQYSQIATALINAGGRLTPANPAKKFSSATLAALQQNLTGEIGYDIQQDFNDLVNVALTAPGLNINAQDSNGYTLLSLAAQAGSLSLIEQLLKISGININLADNNGLTPLAWAVQQGSVPLVQALLKAPGIKVDLADQNGETPLMWASGAMSTGQGQIQVNTNIITQNAQNYAKIITMLIKAGANANAQDISGNTPLVWAQYTGLMPLIQANLQAKNVPLNTL